MKKVIMYCLWMLLFTLTASAQGYSSDKVAFTNFLVRMYNNAPFDGVRIVEDYDNKFLISVLALDKEKYKNNESVINRVASMKSTAQLSRFFNGAVPTEDIVIRTTERSDGTSVTETIESIREHSVGYVNAMEQLTNFTRSDGKQVFIFIKQVE